MKFFFLGNVICSIMWTKKFFSLERKFFLSPFLKFFLSIKIFFLFIAQKKCIILFSKSMKTNNYFFLSLDWCYFLTLRPIFSQEYPQL